MWAWQVKNLILIARFIKGALDKRCQKIHLLLIHLGFGILYKFLHSSMLIIVVHGPKKIYASICKIKGRGLEFDYPPYKNKKLYFNSIADRSFKSHKI
jgi:hypothetical protein